MLVGASWWPWPWPCSDRELGHGVGRGPGVFVVVAYRIGRVVSRLVVALAVAVDYLSAAIVARCNQLWPWPWSWTGRVVSCILAVSVAVADTDSKVGNMSTNDPTWDSLRGVPCDECKRVLADTHDYVVRTLHGVPSLPGYVEVFCIPCYLHVTNEERRGALRDLDDHLAEDRRAFLAGANDSAVK